MTPLYGVRFLFSISSSTGLTILVQCDLAASAGHSLARLQEVTQRNSEPDHRPPEAPPGFNSIGPVLHGMRRKPVDISLLSFVIVVLVISIKGQSQRCLKSTAREAENFGCLQWKRAATEDMTVRQCWRRTLRQGCWSIKAVVTSCWPHIHGSKSPGDGP